jgi:hypothetical protein
MFRVTDETFVALDPAPGEDELADGEDEEDEEQAVAVRTAARPPTASSTRLVISFLVVEVRAS